MKLISLLVCLGLFSACTSTKGVEMVKEDAMPETKIIESTDGKGLNEYPTPEIQPEVFFESGAKIRSAVLADSGTVLWSSFSYDPTTWFSGGSISIGDTLYTCTSDEHTLIAFHKNTGEFLRVYPTVTNAYTRPLNGDLYNFVIFGNKLRTDGDYHLISPRLPLFFFLCYNAMLIGT